MLIKLHSLKSTLKFFIGSVPVADAKNLISIAIFYAEKMPKLVEKYFGPKIAN